MMGWFDIRIILACVIENFPILSMLTSPPWGNGDVDLVLKVISGRGKGPRRDKICYGFFTFLVDKIFF